MTALLSVWALSIAILFAVTLYAYHRAQRVPLPRYVPRSLSDFVHEALSHLAIHLHSAAGTAKPHARRFSETLISISRRGHDVFIDRVFGRMSQERGRSASFFLKYIAEHKEREEGSPEQKAGL